MNKQIGKTVRDKLDVRVLVTAIFVGVLEFEVFTFARGVVLIARQDAWISVILAAIILSICIIFLVKLSARFPEENFFQYSRKVWGKPLAFLIAVGYLTYWFGFLVILFQEFCVVNQTIFLHETPQLIPMMLLAIAAVYLASYGITAIIRFFQLMLPYLVIPLVLILMLGLYTVKLDFFQPVLANGFKPVLMGALRTIGGTQGLEILLFLSPFLTSSVKSLKPALLGLSLNMFNIFMQMVLVIGVMGVANTHTLVWPGIGTASIIQLPGFPVERFELFLTLPWIIGIFTTMCLFIYLLSTGLSEIFNFKRNKFVTFLAAVAVVGTTYLIPNQTLLMGFREAISYLTIVFTIIIPVFTLVLAMARRQEGRNND